MTDWPQFLSAATALVICLALYATGSIELIFGVVAVVLAIHVWYRRKHGHWMGD